MCTQSRLLLVHNNFVTWGSDSQKLSFGHPGGSQEFQDRDGAVPALRRKEAVASPEGEAVEVFGSGWKTGKRVKAMAAVAHRETGDGWKDRWRDWQIGKHKPGGKADRRPAGGRGMDVCRPRMGPASVHSELVLSLRLGPREDPGGQGNLSTVWNEDRARTSRVGPSLQEAKSQLWTHRSARLSPCRAVCGGTRVPCVPCVLARLGQATPWEQDAFCCPCFSPSP